MKSLRVSVFFGAAAFVAGCGASNRADDVGSGGSAGAMATTGGAGGTGGVPMGGMGGSLRGGMGGMPPGGAAGMPMGGAGGSSGAPGGEVRPLYPVDGLLWNDYVKNDGTTRFDASDTDCEESDESTSPEPCLHAGELRVYDTPGFDSCAGVTASDSEDAFDWVCDESTGIVRVVSTRLRPGKFLSDLLDFTATPQDWKDMTVTATDGSQSFTSDATKWWVNPVAVDNDGGDLDVESTIYIVTADSPGGDYVIRAHKIGFVTQPGVVIPGANAAGKVLSVDQRDWLWLEANIDATGDFNAINYEGRGSFWSVMRGVTATGASQRGIAGIGPHTKFIDITTTGHGLEGFFSGGNYQEVRNIVANNNRRGLLFNVGNQRGSIIDNVQTNENTEIGFSLTGGGTPNFPQGFVVTNIETVNNGTAGFRWLSGSANVLRNVVALNNGNGTITAFDSVTFSCDRSVVQNVLTSNSGDRGLVLRTDNVVINVVAHNHGATGLSASPPGNIVIGATMANNDGRGLDIGPLSVSMNVAAVNNRTNGLSTNQAGGYQFYNVGLTDNGQDLSIATNVMSAQFHGELIVTDPSGSCDTANVGIDDACQPVLPSTHTVSSGSLEGSFVGKVAMDSVNASHVDGVRLFEEITDWVAFERPNRSWGLDGGSFADPTNRAECDPTETCRIWDFNLSGGDFLIRGRATLPTGDDVITHVFSTDSESLCDLIAGATWTGTECSITFLQFAYERMLDGLGNENGLCESGETCVFSRNMGGYQGHGSLEPAGTIGSGGTIENVTLLQYSVNGY